MKLALRRSESQLSRALINLEALTAASSSLTHARKHRNCVKTTFRKFITPRFCDGFLVFRLNMLTMRPLQEHREICIHSIRRQSYYAHKSRGSSPN
jgi:hypothetical protein